MKICTRTKLKEGDSYGNRVIIGAPFLMPATEGRRRPYAVCQCPSCGTIEVLLLHGGRSCRCRCVARPDACKKTRTHGMSNTRLYSVWKSMKWRCKFHHAYAGRGISVCVDWSDDFRSFAEWSLLNGYEDHLEIDRINVDGNYGPGNCRFVTDTVNQRNKRDTRYLTAFGETMSVSSWPGDKRCKVKYRTLAGRVARGWPDEIAISTPPGYFLRDLRAP